MRAPGQPFRQLKFRTMIPENEDFGATGAHRHWRITPLDHFLRRTRLDPLPQLFNILKGDLIYQRHHDLRLDLWIMWNTLKIVMAARTNRPAGRGGPGLWPVFRPFWPGCVISLASSGSGRPGFDAGIGACRQGRVGLSCPALWELQGTSKWPLMI